MALSCIPTSPATTPDTLELLLGRWSLTRTLHDAHAAMDFDFIGLAEVTSSPAGVRYLETGELCSSRHRGPTRRELLLFPRDGGRVALHFSDGRPFVELDLGQGRARVSHPCREDLYVLEFELFDRDHLEERWTVTGPEKDLRAETTWRREA